MVNPISLSGARAELQRRRTAARGTFDGELGSEESVRERELGEGEREGARPFIERGEERESRRGGGEDDRPSMAPLGRENVGEGERVAMVSGAGSERAQARGRLAAAAAGRRAAQVGPT
jgi:hypothetical protein